jgi:hypothetical protein
MSLSIPPITSLPQPPLKTDPANFAERADTFLDALPDFVAETNTAIGEMNKITSGLDQQSPIAAYSAATTYDFPDVVAGSDGYSYRCVGTSVTGVDPTTDDGTYWRKLGVGFASEVEALAGTEDGKALSPETGKAMIRAMAIPEPPSGVSAVENVAGMNLRRTGANQITVSKGACLDSTLTTPLALTADTAVTIPAAANTLYHVFVVRLVSDGSITVKTYTSEAAVASDGTVDRWRWIGWWRTVGDSTCAHMINSGEYYAGYKASNFVLSTSIGSSYATVDHSSFIPVDRVVLILYGARDGSVSNGDILASDDGTNVAFLVGRTKATTSDTDGNAWGGPDFVPSMVVFNPDRQFRCADGTVDLLIHQVKVRR